MRKILFVTLVLSVYLSINGFSQEIQRLTFTDRRADGVIIGNVTVNAVFMAWTQQRVSIENGMQVINERVYINGAWQAWELMGREPSHVSTIRQHYDIIMAEYQRYPRGAVRLYKQGIQGIRIMAIPDGRSSPLWWSEDGRSYNVMYEFWAIAP